MMCATCKSMRIRMHVVACKLAGKSMDDICKSVKDMAGSRYNVFIRSAGGFRYLMVTSAHGVMTLAKERE